MGAGYYMLTLVLHNQDDDISPPIASYESRLSFEGLPDIPFHNVDLIHGHQRYGSESVETRKRLLIAFSVFARTLPIQYTTFAYSRSEVPGKTSCSSGYGATQVPRDRRRRGVFPRDRRRRGTCSSGSTLVWQAFHEIDVGVVFAS